MTIGVLPARYPAPGAEDSDYLDRQAAKARTAAQLWLENHVGALWPGAASCENPRAIDWKQLIDPQERTGPGRLDAQHVRANSGPIESYTMATAGSLRFRLRTDESGYRNLFLAGDRRLVAHHARPLAAAGGGVGLGQVLPRRLERER